jgi:hypothetical protein
VDFLVRVFVGGAPEFWHLSVEARVVRVRSALSQVSNVEFFSWVSWEIGTVACVDIRGLVHGGREDAGASTSPKCISPLDRIHSFIEATLPWLCSLRTFCRL